ncbi:hypothetical protein [Streptomyces sp. G1]|uniref:hypothetical protein n=1 Tax=Streptomyces sp. G1 TaxID=361572 RepID=UPI00202FBD8C|nr:hypothetical protein [Streptomyces sp. G1]MCM1974728.1 hypothetical protein [Streptomyces sp. G1]
MDPRDHRTLAGALCADGSSRAHFERIWESLIEQFGAPPDLWLATVELFMQARRQPELRVALAGGTTQGRRDPSSAPTATEVLEGIRALAEIAR